MATVGGRASCRAALLSTLLYHIVTFSMLYIPLSADNPSSIVAPYAGPDPGYILAESDGGLSNRLRVMSSYMHIADVKYGGAHLVFVWDKNNACPGHFLTVFEPVSKLVFATNSSRYVLDKGAKIVYENSYALMSWIFMQNGIPKNRIGYPSWNQIEYNMYSKYFPTREVMLKVNDFVTAHDICNSSAMHLRVTDLDKIMGERKRLNIHSYFQFVESRPAHEKVYILTDNPETQLLFVNKYGKDKIVFYRAIDDLRHQKALFVRNSNSSEVVHSGPFPSDYRFTSLEHTVIDVMIAAHARTFKGSGYSSLSELVGIFERIGKRDRKWCATS
jgi:hypothetical protein